MRCDMCHKKKRVTDAECINEAVGRQVFKSWTGICDDCIKYTFISDGNPADWEKLEQWRRVPYTGILPTSS